MEDIKHKAYDADRIAVTPSGAKEDMLGTPPSRYTAVPRTRRCRRCRCWVNINVDQGMADTDGYVCEQCLTRG